jgi:general secretion pathway protein E
MTLAESEQDVMPIEPLTTTAHAIDITYAFARRFGVILLADSDGPELAAALREDADPRILFEVQRNLARALTVQIVSQADFDRHIAQRYPGNAGAAVFGGARNVESSELDLIVGDRTSIEGSRDNEDASAIGLINGIIAEATRESASAVHIEPHQTGLVLRMRVAGALREILRMPPQLSRVVVRRIKRMAGLGSAALRAPQDGSIRISIGDQLLDLRVSTLPGRAGERVVLHLPDAISRETELKLLGMNADIEAEYRAALGEPDGIILFSGPRGTGKTASLYAGIRLLNDGTRNILTIEDPIEHAIEGVGQTEVDAKAGLSFAVGLRAILRQDPDIVVIDEIRDPEAADIAVQASQEGHLILCAIHAQDTVGALQRMRDMKVDRSILASTLRAVIAQRLVLRLCPDCREPVQADDSVAARLGFDSGAVIYQPRGCEACGHSGFKGRLGVFEMIRVDDTIRKLIRDGGDEAIIARHAFLNNRNLGAAARALVRTGETTPEEAIRVSRRDAVDS